MAFCTKCRSQLSQQASFCGECGEAVSVLVASQMVQSGADFDGPSSFSQPSSEASTEKALLFYPMMFLRPFVKLSVMLTYLFLVPISAYFFIMGEKANGAIAIGICFVAFMVGWLWDTALLHLNPEGTGLFIQR